MEHDMAAESMEITGQKFGKGQILASARFADSRDLVSALLDGSKEYTLQEIEKMIDDYRKGKVR